MKRLFQSLMFVAAAATTFASCTKDPATDRESAPGQVILRFTADDGAESQTQPSPESRTTFGQGYAIHWNDASDRIGIYIYDSGTSVTGTSNAEGSIARTNGAAQFTATVDKFYAGDLLCACYPYDAAKTGSPGSVELTIPAGQEQLLMQGADPLETYEGKNNPMVAVNHVFTEEEAATAVLDRPVKFRPLGATGEFAVYTSQADFNGEVVRAFTFTNSTAEAVAGTFAYDLTAVPESGELTPIDRTTILPGQGSNRITLTVDSELGAPVSTDQTANVLYLTVIPGQYTGDFVVTTDKATYTFAGKTVDFRRAYVRRFTLDLKNAVRSERVVGPYMWHLASGDLSTNADTPKTLVTAGTPALQWNLACSDPCYFWFDRDRGVQIGSGSIKGAATLTTNLYGDEVKSIVVNASVAGSGQADLSVYLDNTLLNTASVTNTAAADFTFAPATPIKAGNIRIEMKSSVQKAMYLKSVTILSATSVAEPLPAPVPTVEGTTVSWAPVADASGYRYTTDAGLTQVDLAETTLDCSLWTPGTYSVRVRARGDGLVHADSEWSAAVEVIIADTNKGRYIKVENAQNDWSGTYLIAYTDGAAVKILTGKGSGSYGDYADVTLQLNADGSIKANDATNQYACTIEKSEAGNYTIKLGSFYLGYTGSGNSLYFDSSYSAGRNEWTITESNVIKNVSETDRQIQWNDKTPRFACYTGSQKAITLYQLEDKTPRIQVAEADKSLTVAATEALSGSIAFMPKNLTGDVTASVTDAVGDWFAATVDNANAKVDWTAAPNEGTAPRTATLTLSADGANPVMISVVQRAPARALGHVTVDTPTVDGLAITVSWNAVENASGYAWRVVKSTAPDANVQSGTTDRSTTTVTVPALDPHTEYTIHVQALGDGVDFIDSAEVSVTATTGGATQLGAITIDSPAVEGTTVTVNWSAVENASGYAWRIVEDAEPGTDVQTGQTGATVTSAVIRGLEADTPYTIHVRALGDGSAFMDSEEVSVGVTTGASLIQPITLSFDFTKHPDGWPTSAGATEKSYDYSLDGTSYTWSILQAYYHTNQKTLWFVKSKNGYATLPAIASMRITKVDFKKNSGGTKTAKVSLKLDGSEIGSSTSQTTASIDVAGATSASVITICNDTSSNFGLDSITIHYEAE